MNNAWTSDDAKGFIRYWEMRKTYFSSVNNETLQVITDTFRMETIKKLRRQFKSLKLNDSGFLLV
jgi:hypothetical protein